MNITLSEIQVVEIAKEFLEKRLGHPPPPLLSVRHRSPSELEGARKQIRQVLLESGVIDDKAVAFEIARAGCDRAHWIVAFRHPDPPGSASTMHATMVRVFDDNGEAISAN